MRRRTTWVRVVLAAAVFASAVASGVPAATASDFTGTLRFVNSGSFSVTNIRLEHESCDLVHGNCHNKVVHTYQNATGTGPLVLAPGAAAPDRTFPACDPGTFSACDDYWYVSWTVLADAWNVDIDVSMGDEAMCHCELDASRGKTTQRIDARDVNSIDHKVVGIGSYEDVSDPDNVQTRTFALANIVLHMHQAVEVSNPSHRPVQLQVAQYGGPSTLTTTGAAVWNPTDKTVTLPPAPLGGESKGRIVLGASTANREGPMSQMEIVSANETLRVSIDPQGINPNFHDISAFNVSTAYRFLTLPNGVKLDVPSALRQPDQVRCPSPEQFPNQPTGAASWQPSGGSQNPVQIRFVDWVDPKSTITPKCTQGSSYAKDDIERRDMRGIAITGVLSDVRFAFSDLSYAKLVNLTINGTKPPRALPNGKAYPDSADFSGVTFARADLRGAVFVQTDLQGAWFWRTELTGTQFKGSDLSYALFTRAVLRDTGGNVLTGAELSTGLQKLARANGNVYCNAVFPDATGRPFVSSFNCPSAVQATGSGITGFLNFSATLPSKTGPLVLTGGGAEHNGGYLLDAVQYTDTQHHGGVLVATTAAPYSWGHSWAQDSGGDTPYQYDETVSGFAAELRTDPLAPYDPAATPTLRIRIGGSIRPAGTTTGGAEVRWDLVSTRPPARPRGDFTNIQAYTVGPVVSDAPTLDATPDGIGVRAFIALPGTVPKIRRS